MKIKFGAFVVDGRGKIGGTVFSKNKGGAYAKNKVTPVNPNTVFQQAVRSVFGFISANWRGLTNAQREAWNNAVNQWQSTNIFADVITPSGKALYQKLNTALVNIGFDPLELPPSPQNPTNQLLTDLEADSTGSTITYTLSFATDATDTYTFYGVAPNDGAATNVSNLFRKIDSYAGDSMPTPAQLGAAYANRLGAFSTGQAINIRIDIVRNATGQIFHIGQRRAIAL